MFAQPLQQVDRVFVLSRGRKLVYFGGCDYLRLSSDPRIAEAMRHGLNTIGLNVAASRKTTGNHPLYEQVERETARFFGAERAVLVSNGYLTNLAVAQALELSRVLIDERSHSSLHDAVQLGGFKKSAFAHRNPSDLARKASKAAQENFAVLTDGLFASDGTIAPLDAYRTASGSKSLLWVDDSHAGGILGRNGAGAVDHCGLNRANLVQTITFSKAFGVYGGAVLCSRQLAESIIERSRIASGNTPLPLPLAQAVLTSLNIVRTEPDHRQRLWHNTAFMRNKLGIESIPSPILSFSPEPAIAKKLRRSLLDAGIFPSFIEYPGGTPGGYLRLAISSEHTGQQLESLGKVLTKFGQPALNRAQ